MSKNIDEHEHPLHLIDLQPNYPLYEVEYDDDDDYDNGGGERITRENFRCRRCDRCEKEVTWFHRYYYECAHSWEYVLHKFCGERPLTLKHASHPDHILTLTFIFSWFGYLRCALCTRDQTDELLYECRECHFMIHVNCAIASAEDKLIYHPSHRHPLMAMPKPLLSKCNACRMEHGGTFYLCTTCIGLFIHEDCAFLPNKTMIQIATGDAFSHSHPLILSYSFPREEIVAKFYPTCRVCNGGFYNDNTWIFECDKCRYYVHIRCATSIGNENRKLIKNYEDSDYPDLLHLPFPDESYSIQKHLFSKLVEHGTYGADEGNVKHKFHRHPLILVRTECNNITSTSTSTKTTVISWHNPMKKVQLLCNACVRPITSFPFYKCVNDNCKFVLHEWCTQLPTQVEKYPGHPEHTLILHSKARNKFLSVFYCKVCRLYSNGFVYSCVQCDYHIDVTCSFIPQSITHEAHSGHILSSSFILRKREYRTLCHICRGDISSYECSFACHICKYVNIKFGGIHKFRDLHPHPLSFVQGIESDGRCTFCYSKVEYKMIFKCQKCKFVIDFYCCKSKLDGSMWWS